MAIRRVFQWIIFMLSIVLLLQVFDVEAAEKKIDYMTQAAFLIKEGEYVRAQEALDNLDESDDSLDRKRFYTLRGLLNLNQELFDNSLKDFDSAVKAGQDKKIIYVYIAQSHIGLQQYEQALTALDSAKELQDTLPGIWLLRSNAMWQLKRYPLAWDVLLSAESKFPDNAAFPRNRLYYAIELGLYQEAVAIALGYLDRHEPGANEYVALADALRRSGEVDQALKFIELAKLRFPDNKNVYLAGAHSYLSKGQIYSAAEMLETGAVYHPELYKDAAELFRQHGDIDRALYNNAKVSDSKEKLGQRLAMHLDSGSYDQIIAMQNDMIRTSMLEDQQYKYALAYAWFKLGDFDKAESEMTDISEPSLFRKTAELRKLMVTCGEQPWAC